MRSINAFGHHRAESARGRDRDRVGARDRQEDRHHADVAGDLVGVGLAVVGEELRQRLGENEYRHRKQRFPRSAPGRCRRRGSPARRRCALRRGSGGSFGSDRCRRQARTCSKGSERARSLRRTHPTPPSAEHLRDGDHQQELEHAVGQRANEVDRAPAGDHLEVGGALSRSLVFGAARQVALRTGRPRRSPRRGTRTAGGWARRTSPRAAHAVSGFMSAYGRALYLR